MSATTGAESGSAPTFVTAAEASTNAFMAASAGSTYQRELDEYLASLLEGGFTKPEWCILALDAGVPVARAAFWALPRHTVPTDVVLIHADWNDEKLSDGRALLSRVHELGAGYGTEALTHHVDSPPGPPQYQEDEAARIRLLVDSGYELLRDGLRWRYAGASAQEAERPHSLVFRSLREVGERTFVDAIASTYRGTRDSWLTSETAKHGVLGAAQADFREYQGLDHLPEWWELGYTDDGTLAGVVMAARTGGRGVVGYVGVVPEQRGRGLAVQLVQRGAQHLSAAGVEDIGGDCDRDNVAMVKAFERAGFEPVARRRSYRREFVTPA